MLGLFFDHKILPAHLFINFRLRFGHGADGVLAVLQGGQNTRVILAGFAGDDFNGFDFLFHQGLEELIIHGDGGFFVQVPQHFARGRIVNIVGGIAADNIVNLCRFNGYVFAVVKSLDDLGIGFQAASAQERGGQHFFLAVNADPQSVHQVKGKFNPGTAVRNDACHIQFFTEGRLFLFFVFFKDNTGGAVHLADDHTFGAVEHKAAGIGHQRQITQRYILVGGLFHLAVFLLDVQAQKGFERGRVRAVAHGGFCRGGIARGAQFIL